MSETAREKIAFLDLTRRDEFIGWQCRIRQYAARRDGARPSPGMRPRVLDADGNEIAAAVTTLVVEADPTASIARFRQLCRSTQDARERYEKAVEILSGSYFQIPADFLDELTALFPAESAVAATLIGLGTCILDFEQFNQRYRLFCEVKELAEDDLWYQATFWHNLLFNPALPPQPRILAFAPVWVPSDARPTVGS